MNPILIPKRNHHTSDIQTSHPSGRRFLLAVLFCALMLARPLWATTLIVSNLDDSGPGSLRQTLADANSGDIIKFAVAGEIDLLSPLDLTKNVTIFGPGETDLLLNHPVINVSNAVTALIADLTIANTIRFDDEPAANGGAVRNFGNLTLLRCAVTNCGVPSGAGGAIFNGGDLTLQQSLVANSQAQFGGGIADLGFGRLILDRSAIVNNIALPLSGPGTFGGGIAKSNGIILMTNTTISGNASTAGDGGGLWANCYVRMESCTVCSNSARFFFGSPPLGRGGGVFIASPNVLQIHNTLIAGNSAESEGFGFTNNIGPDIFGFVFSLGWNLIQNTSDATIAGLLTGNITGVNPQLEPLQDNGGPTPTHGLFFDSPAIDAGSPFPGSFPNTDQRGVARPQDGDGDNVFITDIGAFEAETVIPGRVLP